MLITLIVGTRPNFMKIAPIIHAIREAEVEGKDIHYRLVHTGQHYDKNMSDTFFEELNIPTPDVNLGCGGGTQAEQTAHIMVSFEQDLMVHPTDAILVVGDVTSTMACAIVAKKLCTPVIHVEAGIRSGDLTMPEEINRMVTDTLTDVFFTTSEVANNNLRHLGVEEGKIHFVGNVMIDTLLANRPRFHKTPLYDELHLQDKKYIVLTLHRPNNVDEIDTLRHTIGTIIDNVHNEPILFPMHPRTAKTFAEVGIEVENLHLVQPLGYLEFNYLVEHSRAVITDSGGITEETTVMGIPCLTLRDNTERPETCTIGTNELVGTNPQNIVPFLKKLYSGQWKKGAIPPLWDGHTAQRIVTDLLAW